MRLRISCFGRTTSPDLMAMNCGTCERSAAESSGKSNSRASACDSSLPVGSVGTQAPAPRNGVHWPSRMLLASSFQSSGFSIAAGPMVLHDLRPATIGVGSPLPSSKERLCPGHRVIAMVCCDLALAEPGAPVHWMGGDGIGGTLTGATYEHSRQPHRAAW